MLTASTQRPVEQALTLAAATLLFTYPATALVVPRSMNTSFFLLMLIGMTLWFATHRGPDRYRPDDPISPPWRRAYVWAMVGLPLAVFLSQWANDRWAWAYYDSVSRFLLVLPIFWALRRLQVNLLAALQPGLIVGACWALVAGLLTTKVWSPDRAGTSFVNPIHFGDIALTMGVLAVFGLGWQSRHLVLWRLASILALAAALLASALSGSRGGWLALPAFAALAWIELNRAKSWRTSALIFATLFLGTAALYVALPIVHDRVDLIYTNLMGYAHGRDDDTSIGIRLQLWRVAWSIFVEHPIFGVGMGGFKALMTPMQQAGQLTPIAAFFGQQEVHSEILSRLSQLGLPGLAAILSVYAVPAALFVRRLHGSSATARAAARMGVALTSGFAIYGLTVETFDLSMTAAFYSLTTAVLLAAAYPLIGKNQ